MASKHKHRTTPGPTAQALKSRIQRAAQEGHYQHALDLAKQLYKQEPTPDNRELLLQIYLGRGQQLGKQGYTRDALQVLDRALELAGTDPAWLDRLAEELSACGEVRRALALVSNHPGSAGYTRIVSRAADAALQKGPAGRQLLPESVHAQFDLVLKSAALLEDGQDEQAREALQGIGLQSPFLEWKVFLRGLSAYWQNDDARALDNWQRLDADRLPARLAAPWRFQIDPAYRQAQAPAVQAALQKRLDRAQTGLVLPLRALQPVLADLDQLPLAFRIAEGLYARLRQQAPQVAPRLAACFYWTVVMGGAPEDVNRYQRVFGAPADDPLLFRLRALQAERAGDLPRAHDHWQKFERSVTENPSTWPGDQAKRVRALVWCHMGRNAASVPNPDEMPELPDLLRNHPSRPRPLSPAAPRCFERSLELAPDYLEAHESLFHYHLERKDHARAEQAARRLLEHFPEHIETLEELGDLRMEHEDHAEALALFLRALKANPLERGLRAKVATAYLFQARSLVESGRFDEARAGYQTALAYEQGTDPSNVYCKWSACEFKAGDSLRAEELLKQALTHAGNRLAVAYSMLVEVIRLKLPSTLRTRFNKEFNAGLAEPPSAAAALSMAVTVAAHKLAAVTYHGQKTHEKKILAYLEKSLHAPFTEEQWKQICEALLDMEALTLLRKFAARAATLFYANPYFPFVEAESYVAMGPQRCPTWKAQPLLDRAESLARALPADEANRELLETIEQRKQMLGLRGIFGGLGPMEALEKIFGQMMDDDLDYDDEY
jgi:tetratricopeptide (TPR) repeat protein